MFGLAAAGGRLAALDGTSPAVAVLTEAFDVHRLRRDQLATSVRALGGQVPQGLAAYAIPTLTTPDEAVAFAARVEGACARAYRQALNALRTDRFRSLAVAALIDAARRQADLSIVAGAPLDAASPAFPGS